MSSKHSVIDNTVIDNTVIARAAKQSSGPESAVTRLLRCARNDGDYQALCEA